MSSWPFAQTLNGYLFLCFSPVITGSAGLFKLPSQISKFGKGILNKGIGANSKFWGIVETSSISSNMNWANQLKVVYFILKSFKNDPDSNIFCLFVFCFFVSQSWTFPNIWSKIIDINFVLPQMLFYLNKLWSIIYKFKLNLIYIHLCARWHKG